MNYFTKYTAEGRSFTDSINLMYLNLNNEICLTNLTSGMIYQYVPNLGLYKFVGSLKVFEREDKEYQIMTEESYLSKLTQPTATAYKICDKYFLVANENEVLYMSEGGIFHDYNGELNLSNAETIAFDDLMLLAQRAEESYVSKLREEGKISKEKF